MFMNIHFISIGGTVMHNLAIALHKKGEAMSIQAAGDYAKEQIAGALAALEQTNP